ncbi:MAG: DnaJ domain-containing protein [Bacteroidota bacterium]
MEIDKFYKILGLDEDASEEEIRRRYRSLAKKLHPDHNTSHNAQEQFILINEAYEGIIFLRKQEKEYRPTKRKEKSKEERLKDARKRYYDQIRKEEIENQRFFDLLTSGKRWRFIKIVAVIGCLLTAINLVDYFLPYRYEKDKVISYVLNSKSEAKQPTILTQNGHKIYLKYIRYTLYSSYPSVFIERTRILNEKVNVVSIQKIKHERFEVGFGFYFFRPFFLFIFMLPSVAVFYRKKTILFTLLWYLSYYLTSTVIVLYLLGGNHLLHILSLGYL